MHRFLQHLVLLPLCVGPALADFLGASYPQPVDLTSDKSTVPKAWEEVTSTLQKQLDAAGKNKTFGGVLGLENVTFSIGLFSLNDPSVSDLQFHYTSQEVAQAPNGTNKVDGDTIYRVASITKLFTVLTGLLQLNSSDWDLYVSDVFPEIIELARQTSDDNIVDTIQWDNIMLKTLASQISGLPTNPLATDQIIGLLTAEIDPTTLGYPPVDINELLANSPCLGFTNTSCYLPQIANQHPNFLPWASPIYSNNNFILLTALMENITGKSITSMTTKSILDPLGMESSYSGDVPVSQFPNSVIIDPAEFTGDFGFSTGSGGIASTINDLAKFGTSILNSTLLSSEETRQWMKPTAHTSRLQFSFGRPWEIIRYTHASGHITDLYTKAGDSGSSSSFLVMIPEYNAGFTVLGGSSLGERNALIGRIGDLLANTLLPAFEAQAAVEAEVNFAGRYKASGLNSSLVLSVNKTLGAAPGLLIDSFISNGSNIAESFPFYYAPGARLVPSISDPNDGLMAFRVATAADAPGIDISQTLFSGAGLGNYLIGDAASYGGISLSLFVFEVDGKGCAKKASPAAWRVELERSK